MKSKWHTWTTTTLLTAAAALTLAGCAAKDNGGAAAPAAANTGTATDGGSGKLKIVTTFYPMYEFSRQVAGDLGEVTALIPAGAEPHDWEPTAQDIARIQEADLFVYNGAGVEHWVDQALKSIDTSKLKVVEASKGLELMEGIAEEEEDEHGDEADSGHAAGEKVLDPHVWLDPVLAQAEVQAIETALEQADAAHKSEYASNAQAFAGKLKELDQAFQSGLTGVKHQEFVTQHAAFGYLAKRYGLTQLPIAGLSPEEEPSAAHMADIVKFAREHQVKTIFFETLVAPKVAETVAQEIGAKTAVLNPIEGLTDEDKKNNLDYIGIMKQNLDALRTALNE